MQNRLIMKHVSIIVPKGEAILSSIIGAYKIFTSVNAYLIETGRYTHDIFEVDLVGISEETSLYNGLFNVRPTKRIDEIKKTDLIVVTTINGDLEKEIENNMAFVHWMKDQRIQHNSEIASLCLGAFLLASTGLLNGKTCATHWIAADRFRKLFPQVNLIDEKIICEDNGIYSSGGAYSILNLLLHLVDKYCGREVAIWCSKMFEIDFDRENQNHFIIFSGQKEHDDKSIKDAQLYIENHFGERISVEELSNRFALSRRNFVRRFKKATSNTPLEYIQRVKIEAAKKSLESTTQNIGEVMFSVGYNDDKAFRGVFKKITGLSPLEYRKKYNREFVLSQNMAS